MGVVSSIYTYAKSHKYSNIIVKNNKNSSNSLFIPIICPILSHSAIKEMPAQSSKAWAYTAKYVFIQSVWLPVDKLA
jgi:hypothetical protein